MILISFSEDKDLLVRPTSFQEVYQDLKAMSKGKSLGPDGINVEFYLHYWNVIGHKLFWAIKCFFDTATLPNSWGRTYIVFIPKVSSPNLVSNYRSISVCNVSYKIISKIISNCLEVVIH